MDLAQIFEQISRKRVVLPLATKRAKALGAIEDRAEISIVIQAVHPREFLSLGSVPDWLFDTEVMKKIKAEEREEKNRYAVEWLNGLFKLTVVEPKFAADQKPDRAAGEIGLQDLMLDRETIIVAVMDHSALFSVGDEQGGPFRTDAEGAPGTGTMAGGEGVSGEAVAVAEERDG